MACPACGSQSCDGECPKINLLKKVPVIVPLFKLEAIQVFQDKVQKHGWYGGQTMTSISTGGDEHGWYGGQTMTSISTGGDEQGSSGAVSKAWTTFGVLGVMVAYSTYMERYKAKKVYRGYDTIKFFEDFFRSFFESPKKGIIVPSNIACVTSPMYILKETFKMGISPIPMPIPNLVPMSKVFASLGELTLLFNVATYLLTAHENHIKQLNHITGNTETGRELVRKVLLKRNVSLVSGLTGFLSGSYINGYILGKLPFMHPGVLAYQTIWDTVLILNRLAKSVGESATLLQSTNEQTYKTVMTMMQDHNRSFFKRMAPIAMGVGLGVLSISSGFAVATFFRRMLSKEEDDDEEI